MSGRRTGPFTQITINGKTYKDESARETTRTQSVTGGGQKGPFTQITINGKTYKDKSAQRTTRTQDGKNASSAVATPGAAKVPSVTRGLAQGIKQVAQQVDAMVAPTWGSESPKQTTAQTRKRDDGAVRANYAARHPEETGGVVGAAARAVNTGKTLEADAKAKAEAAKARGQQARKLERDVGQGRSEAAILAAKGYKAQAEEAEAEYKTLARRAKTLREKGERDSYLKTWLEYEVLQSNPDFEEKSRPDESMMRPARDTRYSNWNGELLDAGYEDIDYAAINGDETARILAQAGQVHVPVSEDVASMYNYIYVTQGRDAAKKYIDFMAERQYDGLDALALGVYKGSGVQSLVDAAWGGIGTITEAKDATDELSRIMATAGAQSQHQFPVLYGTGNVGGKLALLYGTGAALGSAEGALAEGITIGGKSVAFQMSPALQGTVNSGLTFLVDDAIGNAGDVVVGNMTPVEYLESMGISGVQGLAGSVASNLVGTGIADVLTKSGMMTPFMEFVRQSASGIAFSGASVGTGYILREEKPTGEQIAIDLATAFLFSVIQSGISTYTTTQDAKMRLETAIDQIGQEYSQMTQGWESMTPEARVKTATRILEQTQNLRTTLNSTYMAGQQATADQFNQALDGVMESLQWYINFAQAYQGATTAPGNMLGSGAPGVYGGIAVPALAQPIKDPDVFMGEQIGGDSLLAGVDATDMETAVQAQKTAPTGEAGTNSRGRKTVREIVGEMPSADYSAPHIAIPAEVLMGEDGGQIPVSKIPSAIRRYMIKLFRGKVLNIGTDHKVYISKDGVEEFAFPARRIDGDVKQAKMAAGANLDATLDPGIFLINTPDDGRHPKATGGWDNFYVMFETDTGMYSGIVKTMVTERGREFYDITEIQREGAPTTRGDNGTNPPPARTGTPSTDSIPQTAQKVNLEEGEVDALEAALRRLAGLEETDGAVMSETAMETDADTAMDLAVEMLAGRGKTVSLEEAAETLARQGETAALERTAPLMEWDAERVAEFSKTLGKAGATVFTQMYDPGISAEVYIQAMHAYYNAGMSESSMAAVYERVGDIVTPQQASAAYMAGQADATTSLAAEKEAADAQDQTIQSEDGGESVDPEKIEDTSELTQPGAGGTIGEKTGSKFIAITDAAIARVPKVKIPGWSDEQCAMLQQLHRELLEYARAENEGKEVAFVLNPDLTGKRVFLGTDDSVEFGYLNGRNLIVLHNHSRGRSFSRLDISFLLNTEGLRCLTIVKNNGGVEVLLKTDDYDRRKAVTELRRCQKEYVRTGSDDEITKAVRRFLEKGKGGLQWIALNGN